MNKKLLLLVFIALSISRLAALEQDQILMKVNGRPIDKSEFEYLYNKNNTASQQSVDEYLKLFTDYKLKVEEALYEKIDTTNTFVREFGGYKSQIVQPYLIDTTSTQTIAKEIYTRLGENIEASHILVLFPQGKTLLPQDTLIAYKKALEIREQLFGKKAKSFEQAAAEYSEDPSAKTSDRAGYLGWGTAMMFVTPFENALYATKNNEVSMPVRSMFGYHIIKVHNRRSDRGKIDAAHIMFSATQNATQSELDSLKNLANQVYKKLEMGGDYAELCKEYSTDRGTNAKEGNLGWLDSSMGIPHEFMDAAYAIKEVGEIAAPIKTNFGYHIIKLMGRAERDSWDVSKDKIAGRIQNSDRNEQLTKLQINQLDKKVKQAHNEEAYKTLYTLADSYFPTDSSYLANIATNTELLMKINDKSYTVADFANYLSNGKAQNRANLSTDFLANSLNTYTLSNMKEVYLAYLENDNIELRNILKEYHDGILLFDVMNAQVWEKTANDKEGLEEYFKANKKNYTWDSPRYKGYVIHCKDESTLKIAKKLANKNKKSENLYPILATQLNNDSVNFVIAKKGLWAKGENKFVDSLVFKSTEELTQVEGYPYSFVVGKLLTSPEQHQDVKGLVVSDLQEQREKEWMSQLRAKFAVEVNESVLKSIK